MNNFQNREIIYQSAVVKFGIFIRNTYLYGVKKPFINSLLTNKIIRVHDSESLTRQIFI